MTSIPSINQEIETKSFCILMSIGTDVIVLKQPSFYANNVCCIYMKGWDRKLIFINRTQTPINLTIDDKNTHTQTFIVSAFKELAKEKNKSIKFFFKLANNKHTTRIRYSKVANNIEILAVALICLVKQRNTLSLLRNKWKKGFCVFFFILRTCI